MRKISYTNLERLALSASVLAIATGGSAFAQETSAECAANEELIGGECVIQTEGADGVTNITNDAEDVVDVTDIGATGQDTEGAIVVTGSRIKRDTYSSISPLQVITTERSQEVGLFDPTQILQRDESASGQQVDATFQGFVLANGPGSATLNLRGLGADRTLLLLNGRRLAPAGVEGAPVNPSINLLPSSLIDRYDLLLDGASSVYGSDAVAGVGNVILRKDFDGLELFARGEINPYGAGEDYTVSAAYGLNVDRGFIGFGVEYDYRDAIRLKDREFFQGCDTHLEVDQDGNFYRTGRRANALIQDDSGGQISSSENDCKLVAASGRFIANNTFLRETFFIPEGGYSNLAQFGLPGFGAPDNAFTDPLDLNNDGIQDVDPQNYNANNFNQDQIFLSGQKLFNGMAYGEYTLPGAANITPYFEANFTRAKISTDNGGISYLAPDVPAENQFNPCNIDAGGADCRLIANQISDFPIWGGARGPTGVNVSVFPIIAVRGDRNNFEVTQDQYRGVLGVRGDMPFLAPGWTFDTSLVYSRSVGKSVRRGVREDKLAFAIGIDPTIDFSGDGIIDNNGDGIADDYSDLNQFGELYGDPGITPCDASQLANPELAAPDLLEGCVPINLFAPSLLGAVIGDFATQAERDYAFGQRKFDTTYEQLVASAFVTGDLFELQGGPVGVVLGGEYRKDKIDSQPNFVASNGLFYGFAADSGAVGSKYLLEAFGEIDLPLVADKPWVRELSVNLSGRVTKEEFYGTNFTYSLKGGWRPIESLLLKISYGTSFRAPNLRENFLQAQEGFLTLSDPCAVPTAAYDAVNSVYVPEEETRPGYILENCIREGRDPTRVGIDPNTQVVQRASVKTISGGSFDIDPETSRSLTAGFAFEETFGDGFDVALGMNYYDIKLKDSIIEPNEQFIINDCFLRDDGTRSPFCDRLTYDPLNGVVNDFDRGLIASLSSAFLNLNQESVRGIDINASFGKEVSLLNRFIDFGVDLRANHLIERSTLFINENGDPSFDESAGEFGLPKWTGRTTFTADLDRWRATWQVRYTGPVAQDPDGVDPFADAFGNAPDGGVPVDLNGNPVPGQFSDTCLGLGTDVVEGDGRFCRDVGFADEQFLHTASIRYQADRFTIIAGVDNIFNTAPPQVDSNEVQAIANTAIGNGYDYDGREFFASINFEF